MKLFHQFISFITLFSILFLYFPVFAEMDAEKIYRGLSPGELTASHAIAIDGNTGQVLFDKNAHEPTYPASTTKILTAIIMIEDLNFDDLVTVCNEAPYIGGSHIALDVGEEAYVEDLLYALMLASANDAAVALAKYHSGTVDSFAEVMNARAKEMGALNSNFTNPHGMPDLNHVTTAYDLAMITKYAMQNETFKKISATRRYEMQPTNLQSEIRYFNNPNALFPGMSGSNQMIDLRGKQVQTAFDPANGVKRGYTGDAGFCFVGSAQLEDQLIITTVLNAGTELYADTRRLMDYAFNDFQVVHLKDEKEVIETIDMQNARETKVEVVLDTKLSVYLPHGTPKDAIHEVVTINDHIELPLSKGEPVGKISLYHGQNLLGESLLVSSEDYTGEQLLNLTLNTYERSPHPIFTLEFWLKILLRFVLIILLWRTLMTLIRLRLSKKQGSS